MVSAPAESLGWFDESDRLVGVGLVLLRPLPKLKRYLAYLPEGPVIDWAAPDLERWLEPMLAYLRARGAFSVKMGPPVVARRWSAEVVKAAIADPQARRLRDVEATAHEPRAFDIAGRLRRMGWQQTEPGGEDGFAAGQPRYVFQVPFAGRSLEEVQRGLNQQWRRNIKKAEKAGVKVVQGGYEDLTAFYDIYVETAERDRFMPRPLAYFQRMWTALKAEDPDRMRLYLAYHEGEVLAAATMLTVGDHVWYSYGASTSRKREVQSLILRPPRADRRHRCGECGTPAADRPVEPPVVRSGPRAMGHGRPREVRSDLGTCLAWNTARSPRVRAWPKARSAEGSATGTAASARNTPTPHSSTRNRQRSLPLAYANWR
ncbi:lipid II:glycine glycyltransferase FemX [Streptomyces sp. NPDC058000]|uniref:lipid II:glycine glycyltransferase FemX n=1 Tax=Streptomyces sp. NPDC058000 TaxID=3346299 RepID=UPI0036E70F1D